MRQFRYIFTFFIMLSVLFTRLEAGEFHISASQEQCEVIACIIENMGTQSYGELWKKRKEMNKMGDKVKGVPTLEFLAIIFRNKDLKEHMHVIRKDKMMWNFNMGPKIKAGLEKQKKRGTLLPQLIDFADAVGASHRYPELLEKADKSKWNGFIHILLN